MSKQLLALRATTPTVTILSEALVLKTSALAATKKITVVASLDDVAKATAAASIAKGLAKDVEESRLANQKPINDALSTVKKQTDEFRKELLEESGRIETLLADFARKEREKARQEQAERDRVIREAQIAQERLAAAEQAAAAAKGKAAKAAQAELEKARDAAFDAEMAQNDAAEMPVGPDTTKVAGGAVREKLDFEVEDVEKFYLAHPECCRIEILKMKVNDLINSPGVKEVPGLRIFEATTVAVRTTRTAVSQALLNS